MTRSCIRRHTGAGMATVPGKHPTHGKPLNLYPAFNRGGMMYMTERTVERRAGGNDVRMGRLCEAYAVASLHVSCPQRAGMGENREM